MTALLTILEWFATSKVGRALAAAGAIIVAIGIAVLKAFNAGKTSERATEDRASLENLRKRSETDHEVSKLGPDAVRDRLSPWVRNDEG